jgi:hypothetical protein
MKETQADRLLEYLWHHPGASSMEITIALRIVNVTGRISDLRAAGNRIEDRREGGVHRYYIVTEGQLALFAS